MEEENNNLLIVNRNLNDKIENLNSKQEETEGLINKLRPKIIKVNKKRLDTWDLLQSELNLKEAGGEEIKTILEQIKSANAEEAEKEQEELNE